MAKNFEMLPHEAAVLVRSYTPRLRELLTIANPDPEARKARIADLAQALAEPEVETNSKGRPELSRA